MKVFTENQISVSSTEMTKSSGNEKFRAEITKLSGNDKKEKELI